MSGNEVVNFDALEEEASTPGKFAEGLKFLQTKLQPADFAAYLESMGMGKDLTNNELFEKVCAKLEELMKKPEEGAPEEEATEAPEEKMAAESPEFKAFMEQCMKGGKDQKSCAEEWKTQYPSPPTGPAKAEASELAKKVQELEKKLAAMAEEKKLAEVTGEVNALVMAKHLAPAQREAVIKLSAKMDPTLRTDFLGVFKTQKLTANIDAGKIDTSLPEATGTITPERRKELMEKFGIDELIADKGVRRRNQ